jgi:type IV secretion system protein VirB5
MALTALQMIPTDDFARARRRFVEVYGSIAVMNTYLKIALLAMALVQVGLVVLCLRTQQMVQNFKPLVIRINDVGRAEAIRYADFEYQPRETEIRYFLSEFVVRHYSRLRATLRDDYARSLYFLDARLAEALIETNRKTGVLETFLAGQGDELDVQVKNVVLEDLRTSPYRAAVDFEKVFRGPDRTIQRRERYVANIVFVFQKQVANDLVPVNPLGLTITYFRTDQAFK